MSTRSLLAWQPRHVNLHDHNIDFAHELSDLFWFGKRTIDVARGEARSDDLFRRHLFTEVKDKNSTNHAAALAHRSAVQAVSGSGMLQLDAFRSDTLKGIR